MGLFDFFKKPKANEPFTESTFSCRRGDLTIRSIAQACGLSMRRLAMDLGIPTRTMEDWAAGSRIPSPWQLPLIAYAALSMTVE